MMSKYSDLSKAVGWDKRRVEWPESFEEIEQATDKQIFEWYRHLPSPIDTRQIDLLSAIVERFKDINEKYRG